MASVLRCRHRGRDTKVLHQEWEGSDGASNENDERGPILVLRNPRWTDDRSLQDIPIMVFTLAQWKKIDNDDLFVSAAPLGPGELGRNRNYVFALPARFSNADVDGKEEVIWDPQKESVTSVLMEG